MKEFLASYQPVLVTALATTSYIVFINSVLTTLILVATLIYWILKIRNKWKQ